jgi:UDP-4-amino-4-deoxy-L-arabinose-oxoglutarate aminotransferase
VRTEHRDRAIALLNAAGVGVTVNYRSVPRLSFYREMVGDPAQWPVADAWGEETITLPLYPSLTKEEQDYVIEAVRREVYPLCETNAPALETA